MHTMQSEFILDAPSEDRAIDACRGAAYSLINSRLGHYATREALCREVQPISIEPHAIGIPVCAVPGKITPFSPLSMGRARSGRDMSQPIICTKLVWCAFERGR
jgi:hypothetical protein